MKTFFISILLIFFVVITTTLVKYTSQKFDEHYIPPKQKYVKQRLKTLEPIKLGLPSFGSKDSIVRIYSSNGDNICTGTVISPNYVLTAAHCILTDGGSLSREKLIIKSLDKQISVPGIPASAYTRTDVALIMGRFNDFKITRIETSPINILAQSGAYIACGFPLGGAIFCITMPNFIIKEFFLVTNSPLFPGMSGGPLINLKTGNIIGVNSRVDNTYSLYGPTIELFTVLGVEVLK